MTPPPINTHPPNPTFPPHAGPRTWLITACTSPIGIAIARQALSHGDNVIAGLNPRHLADAHGEGGEEAEDTRRGDEFREFWRECEKEGWKERCKGVELDGSVMGQCQAAVAEAVESFGKLDILLCCSSEALVGTVEELAASPRTQSLVREQFETNFFGPVNCIKAALPTMRKKSSGHVLVLTGITGHLGTPGLGMYCAAGWALEGFCDSLAYEIAPFNIKMTIVQPTMEIGVLTNKILSAPPMPQYLPDSNPAPLFRGIIGGLLDRLDTVQQNGNHEPASLTGGQIQTLYPKLPPKMQSSLLAETINAIIAIGGHDNPPARHIVGHEGVASVKEKLKTVSEELEDFVDCSCAVDIDDGHGIEDANGSIDGMV
ncbi:hypothetical protein IMSHALPRED_003950 [Imshaugia aleurites]|uniref:NAD(P)-binding protein n=1 Tax=Imshaugia aleurites TaxID=172621 RepID=A0A8H3EI87_9LECA|nr:hypothetical protein IMSHALPRED_003950 [Imshaugia aleurites]